MEKMSTKSVGSQFRISEGDWVCDDTNCANVNFARRDKCNICGKDKPNSGKDDKFDKKRKLGHEIGKVAAEKSKGLFSADDWQCGRCGNVNWARRHTCNMCNAPKFGDNDERTGLGGGYNERDEHVEYIQREESDEEYDDFGRKKKKKFRKSNDRNEDTNDSKHKNITNSSKYDEKQSSKHFKHKDSYNKQKDDNEEEEESEEEVDVSKYKLDSDDDEDDNEDNEEDLSKYDLTSD